jgi:hypothetical protein
VSQRAYHSHRLPAEWASPRELFRAGQKLRALLASEPNLTVIELMRRTRAPQKLVETVRRRVLAARTVAP